MVLQVLLSKYASYHSAAIFFSNETGSVISNIKVLDDKGLQVVNVGTSSNFFPTPHTGPFDVVPTLKRVNQGI